MRHQSRHRSRRILAGERLAVSNKHPALRRPVRRRSTPQPVSGHGGDKQTHQVPDSTSTQPGRFGEVMDATDEQGQPASPAEQRRQEHEWGIAAEQALRSAKVCGHDPLGVERPLAESRQSQQDWRAILRDFVAATAPSDYRWTPPNRRYIASGLYLPSVERRGLGEIVIAVDTSGSIGRIELEQFAGEISAISEEAQPEAIHVVYCDAAVQSTQEFTASEPVRLGAQRWWRNRLPSSVRMGRARMVLRRSA